MDFSKKYDISVYLTEEQLNKRIAEIGAQITEKYRGQSVYLICILKGSIFFTTELAKRIDLPMTMDFMSVSSYGSGTESSGDVKIKKDLEHSIEGEEAKQTAKLIGMAAIKYGDLSNQASRRYIFDVERFTSFEGNTGPYILYTIVRIKSILEKYMQEGKNPNEGTILEAVNDALSKAENA